MARAAAVAAAVPAVAVVMEPMEVPAAVAEVPSKSWSVGSCKSAVRTSMLAAVTDTPVKAALLVWEGSVAARQAPTANSDWGISWARVEIERSYRITTARKFKRAAKMPAESGKMERTVAERLMAAVVDADAVPKVAMVAWRVPVVSQKMAVVETAAMAETVAMAAMARTEALVGPLDPELVAPAEQSNWLARPLSSTSPACKMPSMSLPRAAWAPIASKPFPMATTGES